jgi:hypothetical protein
VSRNASCEPTFGWPGPPKTVQSPRAARTRTKRPASISGAQCEQVWEILAQNLGLRGGSGSRVAEFILAMNVDGGIRFDLAPYGVAAVFRIEGGVGRVYARGDAHRQRVRNANAALARYFSLHEAAA